MLYEGSSGIEKKVLCLQGFQRKVLKRKRVGENEREEGRVEA